MTPDVALYTLNMLLLIDLDKHVISDAGVSFHAIQELVIESKVVAYIIIALMACFVVTLAEIALVVMGY
ncbi:MAG: hypothetical protein FKGGLIKP_00013 [Sodalis sp. Fse]|nr:MAG: hypothetical protein FKGGLIKP_00013 [Sodalis sp. Fse]